MYCSHCGAAVAGGNFCQVCGASVRQEPATPVDPEVWRDEVRYHEVVAIPAVRDRIAAAAAAADQPFDLEDWLHRMDHAYPGNRYRGGIAGAQILNRYMQRKGVASGRQHIQLVRGPAGWVLVDVLCALARVGYALQQVQQGTDSCTLECTIPPGYDLLNGGEITFTVTRASGGTEVRAVTKFPGLPWDLGHSRRVFNGIFPFPD
jgi:hypothetical protein